MKYIAWNGWNPGGLYEYQWSGVWHLTEDANEFKFTTLCGIHKDEKSKDWNTSNLAFVMLDNEIQHGRDRVCKKCIRKNHV